MREDPSSLPNSATQPATSTPPSATAAPGPDGARSGEAGAADELIELLDDAGTDPVAPPDQPAGPGWPVLVVDDDEDVHTATALAMKGLLIDGRPVAFQHARSAPEAAAILSRDTAIAVVLLDVVMDRVDAGLELVRHLRDDLQLRALRIILRTGQPGFAPETHTVSTYDINYYELKSELTRARLCTLLTASIRAYRQILALQAGRRGLEQIIESSAVLSRLHGLQRYAQGVLVQLSALLGCAPQGVVCRWEEGQALAEARIVAAAGHHAGLLHQPLRQVQPLDLRERLHRCLSARRTDEASVVCLCVNLGLGGALAVFVDVGRALDALEQQLVQAFGTHITVGFENVALYGQLMDLAHHDPQLRVLNRERFVEQLGSAMRHPAGSTLALLDLDDFASINEAFGPRFGDEVLKACVARMQAMLGAGTTVGRVGADTFGLLGLNDDLHPQRLQATFAQPLLVGGERIQVSCTTGLVRLDGALNEDSELLLNAQIALKRAKQSQRGTAQYFSAVIGQQARARRALLQRLRSGIEAHELYVVYQPQVDLASGRLLGAEALLRWRTADGQTIMPDVFIALAEQSGLMGPIGDFVTRAACQQVARMRALGHRDFRMAVNVSAVQLRQPQFLDALFSALAAARVPGANFEIEITESTSIDDAEQVARLLAEVKRAGVHVAIDDFGTGFSSLDQLRRLRVDRIKIDRSFITAAHTSAPGATIAGLVVRLGLDLGLTVIAEGIETEDQRRYLAALGCQEGQGWLFGRPMSAEQLQALV